MKLNQSGEKLDSIEKHLKENQVLLSRWESEDINENRIKSLKRIIRARKKAQEILNGNHMDTVTVICE